MQIIIMRGLPGAGKDTFVSALKQNRSVRVEVCSADDYHTREGIYRYDPKNAALAHAACLRKFAKVVAHDTSLVQPDTLIVNNTNTTVVEIAPYYRLAEAFDLQVKIVRIVCDFETAANRNVHEVPLSTIWAMQQNMTTERIPPYWREEFVMPYQAT